MPVQVKTKVTPMKAEWMLQQMKKNEILIVNNKSLLICKNMYYSLLRLHFKLNDIILLQMCLLSWAWYKIKQNIIFLIKRNFIVTINFIFIIIFKIGRIPLKHYEFWLEFLSEKLPAFVVCGSKAPAIISKRNSDCKWITADLQNL